MTIEDHWSESLLSVGPRHVRACAEALEWALGYPTREAAWKACERSDWLFWYAGRLGVARELVVLAACACARTALQYVPAGEDRPRVAIETAEAWCRGEATLSQVRSAADDAAAYAVYAAGDAAYAADAAASVVDAAADAAAYAADAAAFAADDAADADADADAAYAYARLTCCQLIRAIISLPEEI